MKTLAAKLRARRYNGSIKGRLKNNARKRAYRATKRGKRSLRNRYLKKTYGLTLAGWEHIFSAQGGCCAVCSSYTAESKLGWCTDHDHATGHVRAILCHPCNCAIHARFTPDRLRLLADYLETHP